MMAFFLLLWLLNASTKEQLRGISDYFAPISTKSSTSGGGGLLSGRTLAKNRRVCGETRRAVATALARRRRKTAGPPIRQPPPRTSHPTEFQMQTSTSTCASARSSSSARQRSQIRQAIAGSPDLQGLANSLIIDDTPEGLRIQIIDQEGLPMFPRGESEMYPHTRLFWNGRAGGEEDAAGHRHHRPYRRHPLPGQANYSNWELSADRANAARRALVQFGVPEQRIARVVGKAANEPLVVSDPEAPGNRRLSVVMLRRTGAGTPAAAVTPANGARSGANFVR